MSDFLDRLAARAIGSGPMLAPRLPSLFESLQRASVTPAVDTGEAASRQREAAPAVTVTPTATPARAPQAPVTALAAGPPVAPTAVGPVTVPRLPHVAASAPGSLARPAPIAAPTPSPAIECAVGPPTQTRTEAVFAPLPAPPRQTRIAAQSMQTMRSPPTNGALLPASTPVFGAAAAPARSSHAAMRNSAAQADPAHASGEPVVHVSIGRLEIRAAPSATPVRRRDGPQPSSLDDYLRQRGGKVAP